MFKKSLLLLCLLGSISVAKAGTTFQTPAGASDGDGNLMALVTFSMVNCGGGACSLQIEIQNEIANPNASGQLISGLTFDLSGLSTLGSATLSNSISSDGLSAPVTVVDFQSGDSTATTTPARWTFTHNPTVGFYLNDLTGGSPVYMIIGDGPYSPTPNSSITSAHNPSLAGPVFFTIDGFTGLTSETTFSNVQLQFGTGSPSGDALIPLDPCKSCGTSFDPAVPEPDSIVLVLIGLGLVAVYGLGKRRAKLM